MAAQYGERVQISVKSNTSEEDGEAAINELIAELSKKKIENLCIEEPSLEDLFMHFYDGKEEA